MLILISGATSTIREINDPAIGTLFVPGAWRRSSEFPASAFAAGRRWAADNGAYSDFDADAFVEMLRKLRGRPGGLFVAAPDVVGQAAPTLERFRTWAPIIAANDLPIALVAQDGLTVAGVPWQSIDSIFIGGTTAWKLGREAADVAAYAKARGKWVHMGRVNTKRRFRHAERIGVDSIDGTAFSRWPRFQIPRALAWLEDHRQQPDLALEGLE